MNIKIHILTWPALFIFMHFASAQQVTQSVYGDCSANIANIQGDIVFNPTCGLSEEEIFSIIRETFEKIGNNDDAVAKDLAKNFEMAEKALDQLFIGFGIQNVPPDERVKEIGKLVNKHQNLVARLYALEKNNEISNSASVHNAKLAIESGEYAIADQLISSVEHCGFQSQGDFKCNQENMAMQLKVARALLLLERQEGEGILQGFRPITPKKSYDVLGVNIGDTLSEAEISIAKYAKKKNSILLEKYAIHPLMEDYVFSRVNTSESYHNARYFLMSAFLFKITTKNTVEYFVIYASELTKFKIYAIQRNIKYVNALPIFRDVQESLVEKYGNPTRISSSNLVWCSNETQNIPSNREASVCTGRSNGISPSPDDFKFLNEMRDNMLLTHFWAKTDDYSLLKEENSETLYYKPMYFPRTAWGPYMSIDISVKKKSKHMSAEVGKITQTVIDTDATSALISQVEKRFRKEKPSIHADF